MGNKVDSKTWGHGNPIPMEPYLKWVWAQSQNIMMTYPTILPIIVGPIAEGGVPYTVLHPDMPTNFEELQKSWIQLKEERDTFETQFYASKKKLLEPTR